VCRPFTSCTSSNAANPTGVPIVFFHGGPGGGIDPMHRRYFDASRFRIVLFDQRGAGKSTPHACLDDNTTWSSSTTAKGFATSSASTPGTSSAAPGIHAVARVRLHAPRSHEVAHFARIFLLRKSEIDWFYQDGASWIFPEAWDKYLDAIPEAERGDLLQAYYKRLTSGDAAIESRARRRGASGKGPRRA